MYRVLTASIMLLLASPGYSQDEIVGLWKPNEGSTIVEIFQKESGQYAGKVVWLEEPADKKGVPHKDKMNPDKSLRDRNLLGIEMLENLEYRDGKWNGTLYSPKKGRKVNAVLTINAGNQLDVNVSFRGFTKKLVWTRTALPE